MAAKKRQTMGKMMRERERAEKRARKQEKKDNKKAAALAALEPAPVETEPTDGSGQNDETPPTRGLDDRLDA